MFLFFILGVTFVVVGLIIIYLAVYYRLHGQAHLGEVYAIEEYVSFQREKGVDREQILYRPIFKYKFNNMFYFFAGGGSNSINKQIGEKINVYVLMSKGPEYCTADTSFSVWFGGIFSLIGLGAIVSFFLKGDFQVSTIGIFFFVFAFLAIINIFSKILKSKLNIFDQLLRNSQMITEDRLKDLNLMKSQDKLEQFLNEKNKMGLYFTFSTALLFFGISTFLWLEKFNDDLKSDITNNITSYDFLISSVQHNPLFLGFAIFSLFGLIAFLSAIQLYFKTYNK